MSARQREIAGYMLQAILFITIILFALYEFKRHSQPQPVRFDNAEQALKVGNLTGARKEFDNALRFRPDDPIVFLSIIQSCGSQKQYPLMVEYAERAVLACKQKPADVRSDLYRILAGAYSLVEEPPHQQRAIDAAKKALDLSPGSHFLQNNYGYLLADNAVGRGPDVTTAIQVLSAALTGIRKDPGSAEDAQLGPILVAETEDSYGWALYKNEQYPDAITALTQAIGDYPQTEQPELNEALKASYYHLGMAFAKTGQTEQARNSFQSALAYDPKYANALAGLSALGATGQIKGTPVPSASASRPSP